MYYIILGLVLYIVIYLVARNMDEKNYNLLDGEQIKILIADFASLRKYSLIGLCVLIVGFLLLSQTQWLTKSLLLIGYIVLLAVTSFVMFLFRLKKLRESGLPEIFIKNHTHSSLLKLISQYILMISLYFAVIANMN